MKSFSVCFRSSDDPLLEVKNIKVALQGITDNKKLLQVDSVRLFNDVELKSVNLILKEISQPSSADLHCNFVLAVQQVQGNVEFAKKKLFSILETNFVLQA